MRTFLKQLSTVCKDYPLQEKVLIVPSYAVGRRLITSYVSEGYHCINLKPETLSQLAQSGCRQILIETGQLLASPNVQEQIMLGVLNKLKAEGRLGYFGEMELTPGIARAILGSIQELKLAGIAQASLGPASFVEQAKARDVQLIWAAYEDRLRQKGYLDEAGLYLLAIQNCKHDTRKIYIIPRTVQRELTFLEAQFFAKLTGPGADYSVLEFTKPFGPGEGGQIPTRATSVPRVESQKEPVAFPVADSIQLLRAYGESNEAREVLRRIKEEGISFDQVAVYYTVSEPYGQLFYNLAQELGVPVTFGQGISILNTHPGKFFFGLLDWLMSDYEVAHIYALFVDGEFTLQGENSPSGLRLAKLLRELGILRTRERYQRRIQEEINRCEAYANRENDRENDRADGGSRGIAGKQEFYRKRQAELSWLKNFLAEIFGQIPEVSSQGTVGWDTFTKGLVSLVSGYAKVVSPLDAEAREVIIQSLNETASIVTDELGADELCLDEIRRRLASLFKGVWVGASQPQPGHIHIDHFQNGQWISRQYSYVTGLDAQRFPGAIRDDAILLDVERRKISPLLPTAGEKGKAKVRDFTQFLASRTGRLTLSYSCFDLAENRDVFPSPVFLQAYRLLTGDETQDYSGLIKALGAQRAFVPQSREQLLDEGEWWIQELLAAGKTLGRQNLADSFPWLANGMMAAEARQSGEFTEYDGLVQVSSAEVDPRVNHSIVLSASQLETLAKCPFQYFMKYILRVEPPMEMAIDVEQWLDPLNRGSLLHSVFEDFYLELIVRRETLSYTNHECLVCELADKRILEYKAMVMPPNEVIYERERAEIIESCRVFLKTEEEYALESEPIYFELAFGMEVEDPLLGKIEPVEIMLPNNQRFYLRGRIDRVDKAEDGFKVYDYKTGKATGYGQREYFKGGRQLQHTLYALALEQILSEKNLWPGLKVIEGGYLFPTRRGEGQRIMRRQDKREQLYDILGYIFTMLAQGVFTLTFKANKKDEEADCRYCDYREVCEQERLKDSLALKFNNHSTDLLKVFGRLRENA